MSTNKKRKDIPIKSLMRLLKYAGATRGFADRSIPDRFVNLILETGIWGLSVLGVQPWNFICIKNKEIINKIADIMLQKAVTFPRPFEVVTKITANIMRTARLVVIIQSTEAVIERIKKYDPKFASKGYSAEIQSISTAIHNMHLMAYALGLGSLWVDSPSFIEKEINNILGNNKRLIACLLIGYPGASASVKRSKRTTNPIEITKIL